MTPAQLKEWQLRHSYTYETAAAALGVSRATFAAWLNGRTAIPRVAELACLAITHKLNK
jgi:transcriptional regulator with XRE-family HTH domain